MAQAHTCSALLFIAAWAAAAAHAESTPRLHPVEAACIQYEMAGQMQNGTLERCHRKSGYEQYEKQDIRIGVGGFTQQQRQHSITIGETIYSIDLRTKTATKTTNPYYRELVASLDGKDSKEMSAAFAGAMGFTPTSETMNVAGHSCTVYDSSGAMGRVCLTDKGLMLSQSIMGTTMTAVKVSIGEGGDDADYTLYRRVKISTGPDMSNMPNLQELMNPRPPR